MGGIGAKRSKKSKSKRMTLKQKYKVIRKVKEHHRKKRKEENKAKRLGIKKSSEPKDPGIPNAWPFKEELIAQLKAQKERADAKQRAITAQRRAEKAAAAAAMEHDGPEAQGQGLEAMQRAAAKRGREYEKSAARAAAPPGSAAYQDYSRRAFYKEFVKVAEASDVIIEVLDARDPLGCRCADVERFIRKLDPSKKVILLLNKIDLVPREVAEAWLKYFREELPCVAFKSSTQKQAANLGRRQLSAAADAGLMGSECLGADALLQLLKNYARSADIKTAITVGVVGLPNVGKSSVINSLKRTRVAQVGNTPGVTKAVQEVHLDKQVTLLDSPGVVFADVSAEGAAAAALRNAVKAEQLEDPALPVAEIVRRCPAKQLMTLYKVAAFEGADQFLQLVAQARGKLKRGGAVDTAAAARIVLQDWNDGRIPYFTLPPKRASEVEGSAQLVGAWGADFDVDQSSTLAGLAPMEGGPGSGAGAFFQTDTLGAAVVDLDGMAAADEEGGSGSGSEEDDEAEGMSGSDAEEGDEQEEEGDMVDEGDAPAAKRQRGAAAAAQNAQLFGEAGQFNPHAARAERKARKKSAALRQAWAEAEAAGAAAGEAGGDDYDFEADWGQEAAGGNNPFAQLGEEGSGGSDDE
ncbi:hypothetical protein ABPG75_010290 [Micractinium tetrahymenae]